MDASSRPSDRPADARAQPRVRLAFEASRAKIGHNGGPPLDLSFSAWSWRRASAAAWKTPPREIALRRLKQAEDLGLTYREFTAVLMDRGRRLSALVFAPGTVDIRRPEVVRRFATLGSPRLLLCVARRPGAWHPGAEAALSGKVTEIAWIEAQDHAARLAARIAAFLKAHALVGGEAAMIGATAADLDAAERAGLGLFKSATEYFAGA